MINLIHGDCLEKMKDMPDGSVDLILTDPPYRITSRGSSGGTGGMLKNKISMDGKLFKHNDLLPSDYLPLLFNKIKDGGHLYLFTNNKNLLRDLTALEDSEFKVFKTLIWVKNTAITNMYYMDSHEYIIFARKGRAVKINNCGVKSVLNYDNPRNKIHPTEKPIDLLEQLIESSSQKGETVLDFTMGSGTTGVACVNTNRNFIGIELDDKYFKIAKERIEDAEHKLI